MGGAASVIRGKPDKVTVLSPVGLDRRPFVYLIDSEYSSRGDSELLFFKWFAGCRHWEDQPDGDKSHYSALIRWAWGGRYERHQPIAE